MLAEVALECDGVERSVGSWLWARNGRDTEPEDGVQRRNKCNPIFNGVGETVAISTRMWLSGSGSREGHVNLLYL